ncbi:uncharacterized protein LOC114360139, partial [Ostrinia furnacalis]|uniref:uncharacterized protein LOC114360139 n=1 Tax=Ostrinia furnacalis TaxID=93504 RepID=UPI00103A1FBD
MDPQELVPLEASNASRRRVTRQCTHLASRACYQGPLRICRLLALLILLPSVFIFVPLYMRYRVFSGQMYPMSMSDMRLIDSRISTTWCQSQVVKSNTTFNAFVVPGQPELLDELVPVSMTRQLELQDDMKEYWGFYLLKGSTVTVSTCVSWPGASLIMIKGYKHLQGCAYIGDDSSEELDELLEANKKGLLSNDLLKQKILELKKVDGKANDPGAMKRHKAGVSFHDPSHGVNNISSDNVPTIDVTDHDPKELRAILEHFHALRQKAKDEMLKHYRPPSHLMSLPGLHRHRDTNVDRDERKWLSFKAKDEMLKHYRPPSHLMSLPGLHRHRDTNVDQDERKWLSFKDLENKTSEEVNEKIKISHEEIASATVPETTTIVQTTTYKAHPKLEVLAKSDKKLKSDSDNKIFNSDSDKENKRSDGDERTYDRVNKTVINSLEAPRVKLREGEKNYTAMMIETDEQTSKEVFEDVLKRLQALGPKGKRVLVKLHATMGVEYNEISAETNEGIMSAVNGNDEELDRLRQVLVEAIDEEKTRAQRQHGEALHHEQLNETTPYDMSNSEFWSSFSSSEEALLECEGLILNLPLTPHSTCRADASDEETLAASRANALTY